MECRNQELSAIWETREAWADSLSRSSATERSSKAEGQLGRAPGGEEGLGFMKCLRLGSSEEGDTELR